MASLNAPMIPANVDSSVVDSSVAASGQLAGMFGAPTIEPLIDSRVDDTASAAPVPELRIAVTSDAPARQLLLMCVCLFVCLLVC